MSILLDTNTLIHAYNRDSPHNAASSSTTNKRRLEPRYNLNPANQNPINLSSNN